jgi:dephospho-CoA kinase
MIIGIVGLPGSGKGEASEELKRKGFLVIDMGDIIREQMRLQGINITHRSDAEFAKQIRQERGRDIVAVLTVQKISNSDAKDVAIVGLRSVYELDYLRENLEGMKLIAIDADPDVRYRRMHQRGRAGDPKTKAEFDAREERELQANMVDKSHRHAGLAAVMGKADYRLENNGTLHEFISELEKLINKIGKRRVK